MEIVNLKIFLAQIFITLLVAGIIFMIYIKMTRDAKKVLENAGKKLEKSKMFNYESKLRKLKSQGALARNPKLANPSYYLVIHLLFALVIGFAGFLFNKPLIIPLAILGWFVPDFIFSSQAKSEEKELMNDSLTLCNMLISQIRGGAYIGSAIAACKDLVQNKRLKACLNQFYIDTATGQKTLLEATDELESNFAQSNIQTLCMIIRQSEQTGKSVDILNDLNKQIADTQEEIYQSDKEKLNRQMTIGILVLFADIIGYVLIMFIQQIFLQLG